MAKIKVTIYSTRAEGRGIGYHEAARAIYTALEGNQP